MRRRRCRQRELYQKVVVLTNYATPDIRQRAMALGADAVFDKSTELEELIESCGFSIVEALRLPYEGKTLEQARAMGLSINVAYVLKKSPFQ